MGLWWSLMLSTPQVAFLLPHHSLRKDLLVPSPPLVSAGSAAALFCLQLPDWTQPACTPLFTCCIHTPLNKSLPMAMLLAGSCPEPSGTSPGGGTCLCCRLCCRALCWWVGARGCREERLSHLLPVDLNGSTSAKHRRATSRATDRCKSCEIGCFLKEQTKRAGRWSTANDLSARSVPAPPCSLGTAGFTDWGHSCDLLQTEPQAFPRAGVELPCCYQLLGCVCWSWGFYSNNSLNLVQGQLFISSLAAKERGVRYAVFSYPEIYDRSHLP